MKRKLRYHSLAERDFVGVAEWSQAQWGAQQTRRYLLVIEAQIQRIAENPMLGVDAEMARVGCGEIGIVSPELLSGTPGTPCPRNSSKEDLAELPNFGMRHE